MTGLQLRAIREQVGHSIEDLARALGVSRSIIQKWESGASPVPAGVADEMREILHAYFDDLESALDAKAPEIAVWPARLDEWSWRETQRPSRWWRQIAAVCWMENGTTITEKSPPADRPHDPLELLDPIE